MTSTEIHEPAGTIRTENEWDGYDYTRGGKTVRTTTEDGQLHILVLHGYGFQYGASFQRAAERLFVAALYAAMDAEL